jgi:hypothetical protein
MKLEPGAKVDFTVATRYHDYEVINRHEVNGVRMISFRTGTGVVKSWPEDKLSHVEASD